MSAESEYSQNQLNYRRSKGVAKAWERERELVRQGRGTRPWTVKEQKELLDTGRVKGYQGHHMKSVAKYPQDADNPKNIQFLRSKKGDNEHLRAHKGNYRNETSGRYNPKTDTIRPLKDGKIRAMNSYELKDKAIEKRGYTKYAAQGGEKAKGASTKKDSKKSGSTEYNGKTYNRTRATCNKNGSQGQTSAKTNKNNSQVPRYGEKTSSMKTQKNNTAKGNYGKQNSTAKSSSQSRGNYGHSTGKNSSSSQKSGGQGKSSGGQSR